MTSFLQPTNDENQTVGFVVTFAVLGTFFGVSMIQAIYECRRPIYNKHLVRFLFPWACFCCMMENVTFSINNSSREIPSVWRDIVYVLEATVAPSLLMSTFDVTYIIHKTRHLQFCCILEGQAQKRRPHRSRAAKYCMRFLSVLLLVLGLLVNFDVGFNPPSPYAGQVGWSFVISEPFTQEQVQVVLSLIPMAVVSVVCFYFSLLLWKYGTTSSMVVHSSPLNPWFVPLFGTLALIGGTWFGQKWYSLLSNVGIFVFVVAILLLVLEVNKDLRAAVELNVFLTAFDDLRQSEAHHKKEFQQEEDDVESRQVESKEVVQGDEIVVQDELITRNNKNDDVVETEKDRLKMKKGKVVEFAEEKTEIAAPESWNE